MNLVLGLSMTSSSVRWVLVEGTTGEGATLDRGSLPIGTDETFDANALLSGLLDKAAPGRVHAIGISWTGAAETTANAVWQALTDRHIENVIAVSDVEAAEALTYGIADIAGYDRVVVCVVEPGAAVVAAVTPDGVIADRVDPAAIGDIDGQSPDAVFVVGSGDVAAVISALEQHTQAPVISADEADLALARGAALAAASAVSLLDAEAAPRRPFSPTVTLAAVLAAAVVTFVVSLSVAFGLTLTPDDNGPQMARSETPAQQAEAPKPVKAAPKPGPPPPAVAEIAVAVPDAAPMVDPPAAPVIPPPVYQEPIGEAPAYIPPAPDYVPPAPPPNYLPAAPAPAYVPPVLPPPVPVPSAIAPQQEPRLRDRIIERIPIINRFHEPNPYG